MEQILGGEFGAKQWIKLMEETREESKISTIERRISMYYSNTDANNAQTEHHLVKRQIDIGARHVAQN